MERRLACWAFALLLLALTALGSAASDSRLARGSHGYYGYKASSGGGGGGYGGGGGGGAVPRRGGGFYGGYSVGGYYSARVQPRPHSTGPAPVPPPTCGAQRLEIELALETYDSQAFQAGVPAFKVGLARLLGVPAPCIAITAVGSAGSSNGPRSLLAADPTWEALVSAEVRTWDAATAAALLRAANRDGSLTALLSLLGGRLGSAWFTALDAQGIPLTRGSLQTPGVTSQSMDTTPAASPSPAVIPLPLMEPVPVVPETSPEPAQTTAVAEAPAPALSQASEEASAPAPAPTQTATLDAASAGTSEPSDNKKKSNLGAILGGAIGGGLGGVALGSLLLYLFMRRRSQQGTDGAGAGFAVANPTYHQAGVAATVTLASASGKAGSGRFQLEEIVEATGTPRSARRRVKTEFNSAGQGEEAQVS